MSTQQWTPMQPIADPPKSTLPPGARALLARMQARVEEDMARFPAFAEAVRQQSEAAARQQGDKP
jgi:hypothetical protein